MAGKKKMAATHRTTTTTANSHSIRLKIIEVSHDDYNSRVPNNCDDSWTLSQSPRETAGDAKRTVRLDFWLDEVPAEVLTRVQVFLEEPFATEQFLHSVETAIAAKSEPILSGIPEGPPKNGSVRRQKSSHG
jgi:hypothetical protein